MEVYILFVHIYLWVPVSVAGEHTHRSSTETVINGEKCSVCIVLSQIIFDRLGFISINSMSTCLLN